jgi:hypothetical protein
MEIIPPLFLIPLTSRSELSLTAGRVGCGSRVGHFDRTGDFGVTGFPFGGLAHRSYTKALMKHVSQLEGIIFSKFYCLTSTLIMFMFSTATTGI